MSNGQALPEPSVSAQVPTAAVVNEEPAVPVPVSSAPSWLDTLQSPNASVTGAIELTQGGWTLVRVLVTPTAQPWDAYNVWLLGRTSGTSSQLEDLWTVDISNACLEEFTKACQRAVDHEIERRQMPAPASFISVGHMAAPGWPHSSWTWTSVEPSADSCSESTVGLVGSGGTYRTISDEPTGPLNDFEVSALLDVSEHAVRAVQVSGLLTGCSSAGSNPRLHLFRSGLVAAVEGAPVHAFGPELLGAIPVPNGHEIADVHIEEVRPCPPIYEVTIRESTGQQNEYRFESNDGSLRPPPDGC